jgi:hypothetical protein
MRTDSNTNTVCLPNFVTSQTALGVGYYSSLQYHALFMFAVLL